MEYKKVKISTFFIHHYFISRLNVFLFYFSPNVTSFQSKLLRYLPRITNNPRKKDDETFKHNYIYSSFHQTSHQQTTIPFSCLLKNFFSFRLNHCSLFLFWRIAWLSKVTIYTLFKLVKAQYFPGVRWIGKFINFNTQNGKDTP